MNSSERFNQITAARNVITTITDAYEAFVTYQNRWRVKKLDTVITDADFIGQHEGYTLDDLIAVFGVSAAIDGGTPVVQVGGDPPAEEVSAFVELMTGDFGTAAYKLRND